MAELYVSLEAPVSVSNCQMQLQHCLFTAQLKNSVATLSYALFLIHHNHTQVVLVKIGKL